MTLPAQLRHLRAAALALTGLSVLSAGGAWLHMNAAGSAYGAICGPATVPHCILCPLSLALLAAGLASLAAACAPRRAPAPGHMGHCR